jgi:hypothetical protein
MIMNRTAVAVLVVALGGSASVAAQTRPVPRPAPRPQAPRTNRVFISINGAYQTGGEDFGETVTFRENVEDGTFSTDYQVKSGPAFNISGGAQVWQRLAVGVGVSRFSRSTPTALSASVPHPFFFSMGRTVNGDISGLTREELAVHVQARAMIPFSPRLQAMVFGGPSFFRVKQGIVNDFEITESYPYDVATFSRGVTDTVSESKVGFNVGADVGYFFTRQVGVGGTAQLSGAHIDVPSAGGRTIDVRVGGFQVGGGLRLRF